MNTYEAQYEISFVVPPKSPQIKKFTFKCRTDELAEKKARFRLALSLQANQEATLITLVRLDR